MNLKGGMNARLKALGQNKFVREQLPSLLLGLLIVVSLSYSTPLFPSVVFFLLGIAALLVVVVNFALSRDFMRLKLLFLGASMTSVALALYTILF
jgi:hypothetical protein